MEDNLKVLEDLALKNYSFAYALFPDELMATQLLIDSVARVVRSVSSEEFLHSKDCELFFLKHLASLAFIRDQHFKAPALEERFFGLDLRKRIILYLREKRGFSLKEMATILECSSDEVYRYLHDARRELV